MRLFKITTRDPEVYDADKDQLKRRVRELEEVVERYRTKRVGPYEVSLTIAGPQWSTITGYLKYLADVAEKYGPEGMGCAGGSGDGGYSCEIKSNMTGGLGEGPEDIINLDAPIPKPEL